MGKKANRKRKARREDNNSTLKNFLLLFSTLAILFIIAEVSLRLTIPPPKIVRIVNEKGEGAYIKDAELGYKHKPNFSGKFVSDEFRTEFKTNSEGFRGDEWKTNSSNTLLILGDSFTVGHGVENNETFAYKLQELLPEWNVINLGVSGYSQKQEKILLERYSKRLHPKLVLVAFYINDPAENCGIIERKIQSEGFRDDKVERGNLKKMIYWLAKKSEVLKLLSKSGTNVLRKIGIIKDYIDAYDIRTEDGKDCYAITKELLSEMQNISNSEGSRLVLVMIPSKADLKNDTGAKKGVVDRMNEICQEMALDCLDLTPHFRKEISKKMLYFERDGHWNPEGHSLAAKEIYSFLNEKGFLKK